MSWQTALSVGIFVSTLILVIWRPKGLGIGFSAMGGAILLLTTPIVSVATIPTLIWTILANISFLLVGLITISWILQKKGVFRWLGFIIAHLNLGNGKLLFATLLILTALFSAFLTNYGSTLLFIPIVIETLVLLEFSPSKILPFIIACGWIADTSSISFTISNLVNSVAATAYNISIGRYAMVMFPISLITIGISLAVILFYFWSDIPRRYRRLNFSQQCLKIALPPGKQKQQINYDPTQLFPDNNDLFSQSVEFIENTKTYKILAKILPNDYQLKYLVSHISNGKNNLTHLSRFIFHPFLQTILFIWGIYIIVVGLTNSGLTELIKILLIQISQWGFSLAIIATGFFSAIISAVCNNLPASLINTLTIQSAPITNPNILEGMIYANIIGCAIGAKITPIGSLSTLFWFYILQQHGFDVSWKNYCLMSMVIILPILFISLVCLIIWLPGMQFS
ncbi:MAG: ArsB/NhaD family transporter [Microcoleaceae cyanobacterium MO_207.B10]|nr:ArsB/NhaD family transporter [Microcoleaceae cyanobacterium MO_207.B10]